MTSTPIAIELEVRVRTCSVPCQAGFQATSTVVAHRSPFSCTVHQHRSLVGTYDLAPQDDDVGGFSFEFIMAEV